MAVHPGGGPGAIVLGFVVMFYLTDGPADAKWLEPAERELAWPALADERAAKEARRNYSLAETLRQPAGLAAHIGVFRSTSRATGWCLPAADRQGVRYVQPETGFVSALPSWPA